MSRKLSDVRPRTYAKAEELQNRPFMITNAEEMDSPFNNAKPGEKVVRIHYTMLDWRDGLDSCPPEGILTMGLAGREYLVASFDQSNEPVGPCTLKEAFLANGNRFWALSEYEGTEGEPDYGELFQTPPKVVGTLNKDEIPF